MTWEYGINVDEESLSIEITSTRIDICCGFISMFRTDDELTTLELEAIVTRLGLPITGRLVRDESS